MSGFLSFEEYQALLLSLQVSGVAIVSALPFAFAAALLLARTRFAGKTLVDGSDPFAAGAAAGGRGLFAAGGVRGPRAAGRLAAAPFGLAVRLQLDRRGAGERADHLPAAGAGDPAGAGSGRCGPERGRANAGRTPLGPAASTSPFLWLGRAFSAERSPPSPPAWANSAPSSPSSPISPARRRRCRWRSMPRCKRRGAKPKRPGYACCRSCWRWRFMTAGEFAARAARARA